MSAHHLHVPRDISGVGKGPVSPDSTPQCDLVTHNGLKTNDPPPLPPTANRASEGARGSWKTKPYGGEMMPLCQSLEERKKKEKITRTA